MYCKNVGARRADILRKELHVNTALDLLQQYPYRYVDRSKFYTIAQIEDEDTAVQIIGTITEWHPVGVGKAQRISATFNDGTHTCELVWFQGIKYLKLELNTPYLLFGKPSRFNHDWNFVHPELTLMSKVTPEMTQGLEPMYETTEKMKRCGLNTKGMRQIIASLMPELKTNGIPETIGMDVLMANHLMGLTEALVNVHFPKDIATRTHANGSNLKNCSTSNCIYSVRRRNVSRTSVILCQWWVSSSISSTTSVCLSPLPTPKNAWYARYMKI